MANIIRSNGGKSMGYILLINEPVQNAILTYTGAEQSPTWNGYDSEKMTISGTTSATNAGTYEAIFTPTSGCFWSDTGTNESRSVTWSINKATVSTPTVNGSLTYNGSVQSPTWNNYDSNKLIIGGTTSSTNAGTYIATFTPEDNYQWSDNNGNETREVSWSINKATVTIPTVSGTLTYNGSAQSPTWNGYNSNTLTIGGTTSGTNAGTYTATFTPKSNYCWSNNSGNEARNASWSIGKATGTLSLSKTSITLSPSTTSTTFTITTNSNGTITATSSNTSVATVSLSGKTVTVTAKGNGSSTITISVAAATNYTAPSNKTCSVTVSNILPSYTYTGTSTLKNASDYGLSGNYKVLTLSGSGTLIFNNSFAADVFLVGGGAGGSTGGSKSTGSSNGGGGGGGGYTKTAQVTVPASAISCTIGSGGAQNASGGATSFGSLASASGGKSSGSEATAGGAGSSGGGGGGKSYNSGGVSAGAGGSDGSNGSQVTISYGSSGAGGTGQGTTTRAFGETSGTLFAGGGGGGRASWLTTSAGAGGSGGGGSGGGGAATANTGGGGGGGSYATSGYSTAGAGGSGIILIRPAQ